MNPEWGAPGVWKFVAGACMAVMIGGAPAIVYAIRTWSLADRVDLIQERQDDVRTRLSVLESQNAAMFDELERLRAQLEQHDREGPR